MQNAKLVAKGEDLKLKGCSASGRGDKRGHERNEYVPTPESKEERQLPIYQKDRSLREPQSTPRTPLPILGVNGSFLVRFEPVQLIEKIGCGGLQRAERTHPAVLHYNAPNVLTLPFRLELRATA